MRGEQGVSHAHGRKDGGRIVNAHDVGATQDGSHHSGSVTRREDGRALLALIAVARRSVTMRPRDGPVTPTRGMRF